MQSNRTTANAGKKEGEQIVLGFLQGALTISGNFLRYLRILLI
jgi:hypothetical protein